MGWDQGYKRLEGRSGNGAIVYGIGVIGHITGTTPKET